MNQNQKRLINIAVIAHSYGMGETSYLYFSGLRKSQFNRLIEVLQDIHKNHGFDEFPTSELSKYPNYK